MEHHLKKASNSIDSHIEKVINELSQVSMSAQCNQELISYYENVVYRHDHLRALGFAYIARDSLQVCSIFGDVKTSSVERNWHYKKVNNYYIGTSLSLAYFPETSFFIGKRTGPLMEFGYVNPRHVLGGWIEPVLSAADYDFFLLGEDDALYSRTQEATNSSIDWLNQRLTVTAASKRFPYTLSVSYSYLHVLKAVLRSVGQYMVVLVVGFVTFLLLLSGLKGFYPQRSSGHSN
ncbi:hypothetical protein [Thaumasiovibrio subtropicus]|uniref:hypothetical protein n=1 Tax=Thaumasiovibrio subtropicus TaxID=1891207 RepID=UPI000B34E6EB|nr:hypothetical protein [Thaumasiovibrio subtropicus]